MAEERYSCNRLAKQLEGVWQHAKTKSHVDLSIIILSYNTASLLKGCLARSFFSDTSRYMGDYRVDNASTDGSADMVKNEFPSVRVIR